MRKRKFKRGVPTIATRGWLGGNLEEIKSYRAHLLYSDVVKHGYGFVDYATGGTKFTEAAGTLDSSGWPTADFRFSGGVHGNCPPGTYTGTITGRTGVPSPQVSSGCTISDIVNTSGNTVTFTAVATGPADTTSMVIKFQNCGGCTAFSIYRPGLSAASPIHNPDAINYYKQHGVIRFMKPMGTENQGVTDIPSNWTGTVTSGGRGTPSNTKSGWTDEGSAPYLGMCAEDIVDFCDALYSASGSNFKEAWICFNLLWSDSYITSMLTLMRDRKTQPWKIDGEHGNECWNSAYNTNWEIGLIAGRDATDSLANQTGHYTQITSATSDGTTITVVTASAMPGTWVSNRHIDFNLNSLVYRDEIITVTDSTHFTVTPTSRAAPTAGAVSVTGCIFVGDRTNPLNFDSAASHTTFSHRWHAKRSREIALIAEGIFGSLNGTFRMMLCHQRPTTSWSSGQQIMLEYLDTQFVDRAVNTYIYGLGHAPYAEPGNQADNAATVLAALNTSQTTELRNAMYAAEVGKSYGLKLVCYEGGPSTLIQTTPTVATITTMYADPGMRTLTSNHWKGMWDRGFEQVAHMDIHFQAATLIRTSTANDKYFEIDESLDAALNSPSQRSLAFQDLWAYRQPAPANSTYLIPGVINGLTFTRTDYSGFSGPRFIWSQNATADIAGGNFNALAAAENARNHYIVRGWLCPTTTKAMTLEIAIYMPTAGTQDLTVTIKDITTGVSTDYTYTATQNSVSTPVPYQSAIAVGNFVVGHQYNFTITVPGGCTKNLSLGKCRFT